MPAIRALSPSHTMRPCSSWLKPRLTNAFPKCPDCELPIATTCGTAPAIGFAVPPESARARPTPKARAPSALFVLYVLSSVAAHRQIFFRWSWVDYTTLARGALRLVPPDDQVNRWRQDDRTMQAEMIVGEAPACEEILRVIGEFQARFNGSAA